MLEAEEDYQMAGDGDDFRLVGWRVGRRLVAVPRGPYRTPTWTEEGHRVLAAAKRRADAGRASEPTKGKRRRRERERGCGGQRSRADSAGASSASAEVEY